MEDISVAAFLVVVGVAMAGAVVAMGFVVLRVIRDSKGGER